MAKLCELCGKNISRYVCQECGRSICELCMEPDAWLCLECSGRVNRTRREVEFEEIETPFPPALKLFLVGFILIFIGVVILMLAAIFSGLAGSFGIIFLLGPIPIIFGAGENLVPILIIAAILTIVCAIIFLFGKRMARP